MLLGADRVARPGLPEAHDRTHLARVESVHGLPVVRVHLKQAAHTLALLARRIEDDLAGVEHSGVDADVGELPHVLVRLDLECERGQRGVVLRLPEDLGIALLLRPDDGRQVEWRGQVVDDGVHQTPHALVLEGRAAQDGDDVTGYRCLPHCGNALAAFGRLALQELLHQLIVLLADALDHD